MGKTCGCVQEEVAKDEVKLDVSTNTIYNDMNILIEWLKFTSKNGHVIDRARRRWREYINQKFTENAEFKKAKCTTD